VLGCELGAGEGLRGGAGEEWEGYELGGYAGEEGVTNTVSESKVQKIV
jgi:hypothetical protein